MYVSVCTCVYIYAHIDIDISLISLNPGTFNNLSCITVNVHHEFLLICLIRWRGFEMGRSSLHKINEQFVNLNI